jgi:rare lipoprotein A
LLAALLAACSSTPPPPGRSDAPPRAVPPRLSAPSLPSLPSDTAGADGPEANPPPDLHLVPDAQPRIEPVRPGGPNKPYAVAGQAYQPLAGDPPLVEQGVASWYGRKFHGRPTASGEVYNMYAMTAAHKTMPLPSYARVRNPANGREVVVRVNDRGPFHPGRVIDLSYTAALKLGVHGGVAPVVIERITHDAIRSGSWRADAPASAPEPAAPLPLPPETAAPAQAVARAARGFWLQLGAFSQPDGAQQFQLRVAGAVAWLAPLLAVFSDQRLHRLQAGPYASRAEAQAAAQRLREQLQLVPAVVERR